MSQGCPDLDRLHRFVLGQLPEADAAPISLHLDACVRCVHQLRQLPVHDPLLQTLRSLDSAAPLPDTSHVEVLITRLRRLALLQASQPTHAPEETPSNGSGSMDDSLPKSLGRYQVQRRLGAGGMGTVYEAYDPELKRPVAVKVPHFTGVPAEEPARQRFFREARAAATIRHPHVCPVYDVGEVDGRPFVVMARIEGQSLAECLRQRGRFEDEREVGRIGLQVARALAEVHGHGIVHRDLKPANILLDQAGQAVLTDFGVARSDRDAETLTKQGAMVGTPAYMAPEQILSRLSEVDARSDIFSLGVVLHQLATGRFPGVSAQQGPRPGLALETIIHKAMAWKPADRYQHAAELVQALEDWLNAPPESLAIQASTGQNSFLRHKWWLALAACLLLSVPAAFYLTSQRHETVPSPPSEAPQAWSGWIDVRIWEPGNPRRHGIRLNQLGALPLKAGDQVRIEGEVNRPAYLYVLWIDSTGKVWPVYPWLAGRWDRPAQEQPIQRLSLPSQPDEGWPIEAGPAGMNTLVMLARETPLSADVDLAGLLAGLPVQTAQHMQAALWFENGEVVRKEALRAPNFFNPQLIDDPVLRTLNILKQRLEPHFRYSRAVSFADQGGAPR